MLSVVWVCEYKAAGKQNLKEHMKAIHRWIGHPCDSCGYAAINLCQVRNPVLF